MHIGVGEGLLHSFTDKHEVDKDPDSEKCFDRCADRSAGGMEVPEAEKGRMNNELRSIATRRAQPEGHSLIKMKIKR